MTARVLIPGEVTPPPYRPMPRVECPCGALYIGIPDPALFAAWDAYHGAHDGTNSRKVTP